jgi:hypoxanthine phosphoribosyltransferase
MSDQNNIVNVSDRRFRHYITHDEIHDSLQLIAQQINIDFKDKNPLFLIVLNGAFMFASDLLKKINIECEIGFLRVSSYHGMSTTEKVSEVLGIEENLSNRHIILVEDIVDTGITMEHILNVVQNRGAASVKIATLLFKKGKFQKTYPVDYIGFSIPNDFVVGYGLDYNGFGRNLKDIYSVIEE